MAYAIDIIETVFSKTKETFFPIKKGYWLRMGLSSLLSGRGGSGNGGGNNFSNAGDSDFGKSFSGMTLRQAVSQINTQALDFLSKYGYLIGIAAFLLYLIGLFFTYISSVFTFVFIDGLVKKELKIKKSFSESKTLGVSLFFFRFYLGLITLLVLGVILSPVIYSFFTNTLSDFNLWWLIPIIAAIILFSTALSIFMFIVDEFVIPVMYFKKLPFSSAWKYFSGIAKRNKTEIFIYFLFKILLGLASALLALLVLVVLIVALIPFVLFGILLYILISKFSGTLAAVIITAIFGFLVLCAWIILISVVTVPIPAFFRLYSIEMLSKLEGEKEEAKEKTRVPQTRSSAASKK